MRLVDAYRLANGNLKRTRLRSVLTIGGVVVSVSAIVLLVSLGTGLQELSVSRIASINALTRLTVMSQEGGEQKLNIANVNKIKNLEHVEFVIPEIQFPARVSFMDAQGDVMVQGIESKYLNFSDIEITNGSAYNDSSKNQILVSKAVLKLFGKENDQTAMVGKNMDLQVVTGDGEDSDIKTINATIVGTTGDENISNIYVPLNLLYRAGQNYSALTLKVDQRSNVKEVKANIENLGFQTTTISNLVDQIDQAFLYFQIVLVVIGGIALFVAGIGIVNTMTISLLERTHEIGIMKAIGARDRDVKRVFTYEAAIIGFAGGIMGVALGWILGVLVNQIIHLVMLANGQKEMLALFVMPMNFAIFILALSTILALLAGVYPARRAAKLSPLQALRYQ